MGRTIPNMFALFPGMSHSLHIFYSIACKSFSTHAHTHARTCCTARKRTTFLLASTHLRCHPLLFLIKDASKYLPSRVVLPVRRTQSRSFSSFSKNHDPCISIFSRFPSSCFTLTFWAISIQHQLDSPTNHSSPDSHPLFRLSPPP